MALNADEQYRVDLNKLFADYARLPVLRVGQSDEQKSVNAQIKAKISQRPESVRDLELGAFKITNLDLSRLNLSRMDFSAGEYQGMNFDQANLQFARFHGKDIKKRCKVQHSSFNGADCNHADFFLCDLHGSSFDVHTTVDEAQFERSRLDRNVIIFLIPKAHYANNKSGRQGIKLHDISFEGANLKGLNFSGLYLNDSYFRDADIRNVDFRGADIRGAIFKGIVNFDLKKRIANKSIPCANVVSSWQFEGATGFTHENFDENVAKLLKAQKKQGLGGAASRILAWASPAQITGNKRSHDEAIQSSATSITPVARP